MAVSELQPEIVTDILARLPVKSLLRFRCVSKSWCANINDPNFIRLHLNRSLETNTNHHLIFSDRYMSLKFRIFATSIDDGLGRALILNVPPKFNKNETKILGSCNGLLCLKNRVDHLGLWNPCTNSYKALPISRIGIGTRSYYGFGHDPINNDYKVIEIFGKEVKVYSLKSNSWRRVQDFPYKRYRVGVKGGWFANGALHWLMNRYNDKSIIDKSDNRLVSFDLTKEAFRRLPQPVYTNNLCGFDLAVLEGSLCMTATTYTTHIDVWMMRKHGVGISWTKLCSILHGALPIFEYRHPLVYSKGRDKILMNKNYAEIIWYNLETNVDEWVEIHDEPDNHIATVCVDSLIHVGAEIVE